MKEITFTDSHGTKWILDQSGVQFDREDGTRSVYWHGRTYHDGYDFNGWYDADRPSVRYQTAVKAMEASHDHAD
jgi:hypothetical protein